MTGSQLQHVTCIEENINSNENVRKFEGQRLRGSKDNIKIAHKQSESVE
jgi:hypothetical protein